MKKLTTTLLIIATLTFALSAQPGQGKGKGGHGEQGARIAQELNLSEQQQADLKELRKSRKESHKPHREEMRTIHEEMNRLLRASKVDKKAIEANIKKTAKLTEDKLRQHVEYQLKVKEIMTPEQFIKYLDMKKERMEKRKEMHRGKKGKGQGKQSRCNGHGNSETCSKS